MPYRLSFSDAIRSRLSTLAAKARSIGMSAELARALSALVDELEQRPLEVGEIMYHLHHIAMPVKLRTKQYLSVVFVVHEASKAVMVTKLTMLERHPFPDGYEEYLNG
jgi:hypothetical protein